MRVSAASLLSFRSVLSHHTRLLEQIAGYCAAYDLSLDVKEHLHPFAIATRVIVFRRFGIAERLQEREALHHHIDDVGISSFAYSVNVLNDKETLNCLNVVLTGLSLPGA